MIIRVLEGEQKECGVKKKWRKIAEIFQNLLQGINLTESESWAKPEQTYTKTYHNQTCEK